MPISETQLRAWRFPDVSVRYEPRDCILYALGLGLGQDPLSGDQLGYVYEDGLMVLPSMATVLAGPGFWIGEPALGIDHAKAVHGGQSLVVHAQLPPGGEATGRTRIVDVIDLGQARGAMIEVQTDLYFETGAIHQSSLRSTLFCRGDGGFSGAPTAKPETRGKVLPSRVPDLSVSYAVPGQAALIFRLSGDYNPLHASPPVAARAGFDRPILHGLSTYGIAAYLLVTQLAQRRPERLKEFSCRFTGPVFPGENRRLDVWLDEDCVRFSCFVPERDSQVLGHGKARIAPAE